ncbi:unnamed protein product [Rhizophagus irregularis]|nr:unnamed protein product [Rhizophagus irregularis]CAB5391399.1 unnamed protein product [Rhizophagus irregularis]
MQDSSSVSRNLIFIIFIIFLFDLRVQSYNTTIITNGDNCDPCVGIFHVYVTDCNGSVIRDAGKRSCSFFDPPVFFNWEDAPDLYCVHLYPQTHPPRNRYFGYRSTDSCMILAGDEETWHFEQRDVANCIKDSCKG